MLTLITSDCTRKINCYHFTSDLNMYPNTWSDLLNSLRKRLNSFGSRNLSLKGRSLVAGSLLASKIWYTSYIFPPLARHMDQIQRLINNWARSGSVSLPTATILQLPKELGGWNLVNVRSAIAARSAMSANCLLFSWENWTCNSRHVIHTHQSKWLKTNKDYSQLDWPTKYRHNIRNWFRTGYLSSHQASTANFNFVFKRDLYLSRKWPQQPDSIWKKLSKLSLYPQVQVNTWRWLRNSLPLKDRVYWSNNVTSPYCRWCPSSLETHHHFLYECSFTKNITKEINTHLNFPQNPDLVISSGSWRSDSFDLWLVSWILDYTWQSLARINLDSDLSEMEVVKLAPYLFRLDARAYIAGSGPKSHSICNLLSSVLN